MKLVIKQSNSALLAGLGSVYIIFGLFFTISIALLFKVVNLFTTTPIAIIATLVFLLVFVLFGAGAAYIMRLQWRTRYYEITPEKATIIDGIFGKNLQSENFDGFVGMSLQESILGKLFNYGSITLKFISGAELHIRNIEKPEEYMERINEFIRSGKRRNNQ